MGEKIILPIIFGIVFLGLIGFSEDAFAVEVSDEPQEYVVAISLKTVGEINKYVGSYDLDFWYSIYSEGRDLLYDPPPEVDFLNGKDIQFLSQYLGSNIFEERVQGTFFGEMDFHDFPFEKVHLRVELEPVTPFNTDYVVFSVDPKSGVDTTAHIPGWFISEPTFKIVENTYGVGETYSRYVAEFTVERSPLGSFLKIMLPILIVVGISFVAYIIPENHDIVAILALLPLVAVVFLHVNTLDELPPLGYLSIFDKIMIISYALIANNAVASARQIRMSVYKNQEEAWKLNNVHLKISPILLAVLAIILFGIMR